jgi:hypothetical protein
VGEADDGLDVVDGVGALVGRIEGVFEGLLVCFRVVGMLLYR